MGDRAQGEAGEDAGRKAECSIAVLAIKRPLGVMAVCCQASSLLGRLETLGPGGAAAAGRRWQTSELQRRKQQKDQANSLAQRQGYRALRTGFAKNYQTAHPTLITVIGPDCIFHAFL